MKTETRHWIIELEKPQYSGSLVGRRDQSLANNRTAKELQLYDTI
jgi:hypothetical protein